MSVLEQLDELWMCACIRSDTEVTLIGPHLSYEAAREEADIGCEYAHAVRKGIPDPRTAVPGMMLPSDLHHRPYTLDQQRLVKELWKEWNRVWMAVGEKAWAEEWSRLLNMHVDRRPAVDFEMEVSG